MSNVPVIYSRDLSIPDKCIIDGDFLDKQIEKIIKKQLKKSNKILADNKMLLLKLGEYLTEHSEISSKKIMKMVKKYAVYDIPVIKTPETYYNYKQLIHNEINNNR